MIKKIGGKKIVLISTRYRNVVVEDFNFYELKIREVGEV